MFPGANAQIYRNEDGEVLGWDYPSYDDDYGYESDQDDWYGYYDEIEDYDEDYEECEHGLSAWLCEGPNHYPMGA